MIEALTFHNFKGLRDVSLVLEKFTVFVGPNGSGKTSILEGVHYLSCAMSTAEDLRHFFSGDRDFSLLRTRGENTQVEIVCKMPQYQVRLQASEAKGSIPPWNVVVHIKTTNSGAQWENIDRMPFQQRPMFSAAILQLNSKRLAAPSYIHEDRPKIASDGHGLASVLAFLSMNRPVEFRNLQEAVRAVIPSVKGLRLERVRVQVAERSLTTNGSFVTDREHMGEKLLLDMENGVTLPSSLASAGTLLVIGILVAVFTSDSPCVLLLDDLDHGLHPKAQKEMIVALRRLLAQRADLQILATSHSPYLIDNFDPEEIRLTTLHQDGSVACAPMKDHPSFSKWKDAMSPGEFWSSVGEKWITRNEVAETVP